MKPIWPQSYVKVHISLLGIFAELCPRENREPISVVSSKALVSSFSSVFVSHVCSITAAFEWYIPTKCRSMKNMTDQTGNGVLVQKPLKHHLE